MRGKSERRLPDTSTTAILSGKEQALGPGIPGRAIEHRQGVPIHVCRGQQRDAMGSVSIQVDASNIALFGSAKATFMALEEEMRPIIVAWVGSVLSREDQVGILIGLGLRGLHIMARRLDVAWRWHHGSVTIIAIKGDVGGAIFQSCRAL